MIITFDPDLRESSLLAGCQCVHIRLREFTARERLKTCYEQLVTGQGLVTIDSRGRVTSGKEQASEI